MMFVPYGYQVNKKGIGTECIHLHILVLTISKVISETLRKLLTPWMMSRLMSLLQHVEEELIILSDIGGVN